MCQRDRGSATAETVIVTPVAFLVLLMAVQFGVWAHAVHVAHAAADTGLATARTERGTAASGEADARAFLDELGGSLLDHPSVRVTRTATDATARVDGVAQSVIPGLHLPVHVTVAGPVDRFTPG